MFCVLFSGLHDSWLRLIDMEEEAQYVTVEDAEGTPEAADIDEQEVCASSQNKFNTRKFRL